MILSALRTNILLRATLVVLVATLTAGLFTLKIAERIGARRVAEQERVTMEALLDVVEPSASAACFVEDHGLGDQVVQSLVGTRSVQSALLRSGGGILSQATRVAPAKTDAARQVTRQLYSPFSRETRLGELIIVPDAASTAKQLARTVLLVRMVLLSLALTLGILLALTIHRTIIRPITEISGGLHHLEALGGARLALPRGHEGDEIGRLVKDVNGLVERLVEALLKEQHLSEQHNMDRRRVQAILDNAGTGIFVVRADGSLEAWTPAFLQLLGLNAVTQGASFPMLFGPNTALVVECLKKVTDEGAPRMEILRFPENGCTSHRWLHLTLNPIGPDWIQGLMEDITSYRNATVEAIELALHDPLTGALNRLGAERALSERLSGEHPGMVLMLIDLDFFKQVNDTFGHDAGDEVLIQVTARLGAVLRSSDVLARLGGDEFLIVVDAVREASGALAIARKIIRTIGLPIPLPGGQNAQVGASVGIVLRGRNDVQTRGELMKQADLAMYQAKQDGRNRCHLYQESDQEPTQAPTQELPQELPQELA